MVKKAIREIEEDLRKKLAAKRKEHAGKSIFDICADILIASHGILKEKRMHVINYLAGSYWYSHDRFDENFITQRERRNRARKNFILQERLILEGVCRLINRIENEKQKGILEFK